MSATGGSELTDIPVGYHTIEFKDMLAWKEPAKVQVRVIGGHTSSIQSEYRSLSSFELDEIPSQRISYPNKVEFIIERNVSFQIDTAPEGELVLMNNPGLPGSKYFGYTPSEEDTSPFNVIFVTQDGSQEVSPDVEIWPVPVLPPETDIIGVTTSHPVPDEKASDYFVKTTFTDEITPNVSFN